MRALVLEAVQTLSVQDVRDPEPRPGDAVISVRANGVCRSNWHAWIGDAPRQYPLVLGHEMAGVVEEVTPGVSRFKKGDRVVVPFSGSDGTCDYCRSGHAHLCDNKTVPGKNYSGGFGEYVCIPLADRNMVPLPDEVSFRDGAALGCRFMTSFHGIVDRAQVTAGEWVVVYGCGGIGLSAINIANSLGAQVIGVDINPGNLELAKVMGAAHVINARGAEAAELVIELSRGGAHVAVDALGIAETCVTSMLSLRKAGRHLQVGLTTKKEAGYVSVPIDLIVRNELQVIGTSGMAPHRYSAMIPLVASGRLAPGRMVTGEIGLSQVQGLFEKMSLSQVVGTYVATEFRG